jgi:signal transduction histidine kinase
MRTTPAVTGTWSLGRGLLVFAPIILLSSAFSSLLQYPEIGAAVLFPPYAVLVAALLVAPRRDWVWYILGAVVAHAATHWPAWSLSWVLLANVANVARALTAAVALRWLFAGGPPQLNGFGALVRFVTIAVVLAPAVGATIGAANVVLHGASPSFGKPWIAWFLSNALTGLTLLPAFAYALSRAAAKPRRPLTRARRIEATILAASLAVTCGIAFFLPATHSWHAALPLYAPLPVLIWAAWRFGAGGASAALSITALAAIVGTDRGTGPFIAWRDADVLAMQFFVLLTALPVLCVAAVASARHDAVQLYRALLTSLADHVAILDARGVVLEVNDAWRRFAGRPGSSRFHRVVAGDDYEATCRASAASGNGTAARTLEGLATVLSRETRRFEMEYDCDVEGHRERYSILVEALERSDGGAVVTRTDVTARRQQQVEIEEQRREVSHLARVSVLGQLSGALAHELNQPLSSISNNAEAALLLLDRRPGDLDEIRAILRDIVDDDQRAAQVIRRLSALLKRGETRLAPMNVGELVMEVLALAHGELLARRVSAETDVAPRLPAVLGDRVQLQQVLLNLILNACEAMSAIAANDRRLVIKVSAETTGHVHVAIRDSGPGIPVKLIDRLFEPFVTTKDQGLGLGLSISRTIVAAHGGRLWAENNPPPARGATMHCLLPAAPAG